MSHSIESPDTQRHAFKNILELVTVFPGLRPFFLDAKSLISATSIDSISANWDRSTGTPDKKWAFWQTLAATCLADTEISATLEGRPLSDLFNCRENALSVIEHLLVAHFCS